MFTGIIQAIAPIINVIKKSDLFIHIIEPPNFFLSKLIIGASISYNGCCVTVVSIEKKFIVIQLINETLKITNLSNLKKGDFVNLERSINFNSEIGGHIVYGHVLCTASIKKIIFSNKTRKIWFHILDDNFVKYLLYKDFISVDGISLTLGKIIKDHFCIYIIPETLIRTTLQQKHINDIVNIEINMFTRITVNTVEKILTRSNYM